MRNTQAEKLVVPEEKDETMLPTPVNTLRGRLVLTGGTAATALFVDLIANFGVYGGVVGAVVTYTIWKHGDTLLEVLPASRGTVLSHLQDSPQVQRGDVVHTSHPSEAQPSLQMRRNRSLKERFFRLFTTTNDAPGMIDETETVADVSSATRQYHVKLADNLILHINDVIGKAIFVVGIRRSGKTTLGARLAEEMGKYYVPMLIPDIKGDLLSLTTTLPRAVVVGHPTAYDPRAAYHFEPVTSAEEAYALGYRILKEGLQVIVDMASYEPIDHAALVVAHAIKGLFAWSRKNPDDRVACAVYLDEAQMLLPENVSDSVIQDKATLNMLLNAYMQVIAVGGALGISPVILSQRFAQVNKKIMAQSEVFFILRQSNDNDLSRCMEYVNKEVATKEGISKFAQGQGVYIGADGTQLVTRFLKRRSDDRLSRTPTAEGARRYAALPAPSAPLQLQAGAVAQAPDTMADEDEAPDLEMEDDDDGDELVLSEREILYDRVLDAWGKGAQSIRSIQAALHLKYNEARDLLTEMDTEGLITWKNKGD